MKHKAYNVVVCSGIEEEKEVYKASYEIVKREAKRVVTVANSNAYERLCQKLAFKEGKKNVFTLARARKR